MINILPHQILEWIWACVAASTRMEADSGMMAMLFGELLVPHIWAGVRVTGSSLVLKQRQLETRLASSSKETPAELIIVSDTLMFGLIKLSL